jgi:hypothetical protein
MFMALYYGNIWSAQDFPFLSQELFNITGANSTFQQVYNQTLILNADHIIDDSLVQAYGAPWLTSSKDNGFLFFYFALFNLNYSYSHVLHLLPYFTR